MNEVIRALKERRSIRSYRTEQVREEDLQQILEAATYAPSGMGAQPVILVAVQDPATIARLSQLNAAVMGTKTDPFYGAPHGGGGIGRPKPRHLAGGRQLGHGQFDACGPRRPGLLLGPSGREVFAEQRGRHCCASGASRASMPAWPTAFWGIPTGLCPNPSPEGNIEFTAVEVRLSPVKQNTPSAIRRWGCSGCLENGLSEFVHPRESRIYSWSAPPGPWGPGMELLGGNPHLTAQAELPPGR